MDWITLGFLIMSLILLGGVLSKNLTFMHRAGVSSCLYLVVAGLYQFFHLETAWMANMNLALAFFGGWLCWKYITGHREFKTEEARLNKLIEEGRQKIADLFYDRRN